MTSPYFYPMDNRIEKKDDRASAPLRALRGFFLSPAFMLLSALVASTSAAFGEAHTMTGIVINAQLFGLALLVCDDFAAAMTPFLTVMCQGATLFTNWDVILPYIIPWGFLPAAGLLFHLIVYRKPLRNGISLWGLIAASSAILLGGLGASNVASPLASATNAFYYFGLSFGLLLLYFLFSSHYKRPKNYDPYEFFLWQMLFTGLVCAFILWRTLLTFTDGDFDFVEFRNATAFRNSLSNIMIMGLPAPFYFSAKKKLPLVGKLLSFALGLFVYLSLCLTTSRTAILFGSLLFLLCLVYYFARRSDLLPKLLNASILSVSLFFFLALLPRLLTIFDTEAITAFFQNLPHSLLEINLTEARFELFFRAIEDFLAHPLFGVGFLSPINGDVYTPFQGCIVWYHLYFPQIFGSMGLVGIAAYTLLLGTRARLMFFRPDARSTAISLTALSLFLYSMTDPGEFMPIPFGMMAVLAFVLLERHAEAHPDGFFVAYPQKSKKTIDKK